jgi:hypothetical protein
MLDSKSADLPEKGAPPPGTNNSSFVLTYLEHSEFGKAFRFALCTLLLPSQVNHGSHATFTGRYYDCLAVPVVNDDISPHRELIGK